MLIHVDHIINNKNTRRREIEAKMAGKTRKVLERQVLDKWDLEEYGCRLINDF
jgi:hypothetical protein